MKTLFISLAFILISIFGFTNKAHATNMVVIHNNTACTLTVTVTVASPCSPTVQTFSVPPFTSYNTGVTCPILNYGIYDGTNYESYTPGSGTIVSQICTGTFIGGDEWGLGISYNV